MHDFLTYFNYVAQTWFPMHLEVRYNKTEDWTIEIWKAGCLSDYPGANRRGDHDVAIFYGQDHDLGFLCAKAHVALREWLLEFTGGC